jgi:uncharacterized protein YacL
MTNRSLWNWALVISAIVVILGVIVSRLLQATLPSDTLNIVVAVFFTLCVIVMGILIFAFALRRR